MYKHNYNNLILNNFFSRNTFKTLLAGKNNNTYNTCVKRYVPDTANLSNKDVITTVYNYLNRNYRNEYFYKNTLMNKILLERHSLNTTTALTETPVGKSKADYIMINGEATVYEIKTDLDNLDRLETQIIDYYKGFKRVCVVTSELYYKKVFEILKNTNVGIYILTNENDLSYRKEIVSDGSKLEHEAIFKLMRKYEFENIVLDKFECLPNVSAFDYYNACYKLLKNISHEELHYLMIMQLKDRKKIDIKKFLKMVPYELKFIAYFLNLKIKEYEILNHFLKKEWRC